MKKTIRITAWTAALVLTGAAAIPLMAEEKPEAQAKDENRPCYQKHSYHPHHGRRHAPPLIKALDVDGDGSISSSEIANASSALAPLDKNGDGNLTRDEVRPKGWKRQCWKGGPKSNRPNDADSPSEAEEKTPEETAGETPAE